MIDYGTRGRWKVWVVDKLKEKDEGKEERKRRYLAPLPKEMMMPEEEEVTPESIQSAQKAIGEILWLSTRTRPELAYCASKLSSQVIKRPLWVCGQIREIWQYLKMTKSEGLVFERYKGIGWGGESQAGLEVFTDSSFCPGGEASHGAVDVLWNKALITWRSSKQPFPTLSTAESEMMEGVEGLTVGDAIDALIDEQEEVQYRKTLFIDNMAATTLMTDVTNSNWRTRHLKLRARHLQWRISNLDRRVRFMPRGDMIADLGTKPIGGQRLDHLKVLMNMKALKEDAAKEDAVKDEEKKDEEEKDEKKKEEEKKEKMKGSQVKAVKALGAIVLAAQIGQVRAQGGDDQGGIDWLIALYTVLVVVITLCVRWLCCLGNGPGEGGSDGGDFSRMPSSEESWSVDDQGREILRPSRRIRGTPALVRACPFRTRTPTPQSSRDRASRSSSPPTSQSARGSDEPMSPRSLQRLAARVRDELLRAGVPFQEQEPPGLHGIQEERGRNRHCLQVARAQELGL